MLLLEGSHRSCRRAPVKRSAAKDFAVQNAALSADHRIPLDVGMLADAHLSGQRHVVLQNGAAGNTGQGNDKAVGTDLDVVGDLDQVVDFGAAADTRTTQGCPVDTDVGSDFHFILDLHPAALRKFDMPAFPGHVAESVGADDRSGMKYAAIADLNPRIQYHPGIQVRTLPDPAVAADKAVRIHLGHGFDFRAGLHYDKRADGCIPGNFGGGMNPGIGMYPGLGSGGGHKKFHGPDKIISGAGAKQEGAVREIRSFRNQQAAGSRAPRPGKMFFGFHEGELVFPGLIQFGNRPDFEIAFAPQGDTQVIGNMLCFHLFLSSSRCSLIGCARIDASCFIWLHSIKEIEMNKRTAGCLLLLLLAVGSWVLPAQPPASSKKLNILVIGAHPDDPEKAGGTMAKYIMMGHRVRLLTMTNGDAGHFKMGGGALAARRWKEAQCAGKAIGAEYVVLDNHDGELMPTLENRREIIRQIREIQADLVFTPRPDDYHPDHRNTALLVRDAAYMVTVPNVVSQVPHLKKNPVFLYLHDDFTRPTPFRADILVDISEVIEKKIDMYHCHESQMYEWLPYNGGYLEKVPEGNEARRAMTAERQKNGARRLADKFRPRLIELYGEASGGKMNAVEVFEVSEYGSPVNEKNRKTLFPFLP